VLLARATGARGGMVCAGSGYPHKQKPHVRRPRAWKRSVRDHGASLGAAVQGARQAHHVHSPSEPAEDNELTTTPSFKSCPLRPDTNLRLGAWAARHAGTSGVPYQRARRDGCHTLKGAELPARELDASKEPWGAPPARCMWFGDLLATSLVQTIRHSQLRLQGQQGPTPRRHRRRGLLGLGPTSASAGGADVS